MAAPLQAGLLFLVSMHSAFSVISVPITLRIKSFYYLCIMTINNPIEI